MNKRHFKIGALCGMLIISLGLGVSAKASEDKKAKEELNVKAGTVASNVYYEDESLSGLTVEDAIALIETPVENLKKTVFKLSNPKEPEHIYEATASQVGISWNLNNIQETLLNAELSGNLMDRYKKAKDIEREPVKISANLSVDKDTAAEFFEPLKEAWHKDPVNAKVSMKSGELKVTPSVNGLTYDFTEGIEKLEKDVLEGNIDDSGEYTIEATATYTEPGLTTERAETFTIIGEYTTVYPDPTDEILLNREENLRISTENMDGSTFAPGETISALAMYGDISVENGYKLAGTYNNGGHVDEIGGGICQTTTTLYNAGLYAELEIAYRRQHSMYVSYVTPSRDAMVYAVGNSDFKMVNNTSDYVTIESWINKEDKTLHVIIVGHEDHAADHSVDFESEILEITTPGIDLIDDHSLPVGTSTMDRSKKYVVEESGYPGVKSRLWKITRDGDEEKRELLNPGDTYKPGNAILHVAPDTYVTIQAVWSEEQQKINHQFSFFFLNGYPLSTDVNVLSSSERYKFHSTMAQAMRAKGLSWSEYQPETTAKPTTKAAPTTKKEEEKTEPDTTKATDPPTPEPEPSPEPSPEPDPSPEPAPQPDPEPAPENPEG